MTSFSDQKTNKKIQNWLKISKNSKNVKETLNVQILDVQELGFTWPEIMFSDQIAKITNKKFQN